MDDLIDFITEWWGTGSDGKGIEFEDIISILGGVGAATGLFGGGGQEKVGYQGKIPKLTAVRDQVPKDWDSDRVPGSGGQQYFSDTVYAQKPDTPLPTVEEAQNTVDAQVAGLIDENTYNPVDTFPDQNPDPYRDTAHAVEGTGGYRPPRPPIRPNPYNEDGTKKEGYAAGGIVEAMQALRGGGKGQAPQMPQMPQMPQSMPTPPPMQPMPPQMPPQAQGIAQAGRYLNGPTDGMGDKVNIDAADGEFVVPADVVGHLGNGNSDAGAGQLESMMQRIRQARTGNPSQGNKINPNDFMVG